MLTKVIYGFLAGFVLACGAIARPAQAAPQDQGDPISVPVRFTCDYGVCIVPIPMVQAMVGSNSDLAEQLAEAKKQLDELRKSKGCAKLDVTEPSKRIEGDPWTRKSS